MAKFIDLTGQTFHRLTVMKRAENTPWGSARFLCKCSCGKEKIIRAYELISGIVKSCGCLNDELCSTLAQRTCTIHGMSKTHLHNVWLAMIARCGNKHNAKYKDYGGRGITVCERWYEFLKWYSDMGEPPTNKHMIERIDNNGNYEPSNCRWATPKEQANNKRNNIVMEYHGKKQTLKQWSEELGINYHTLYSRLTQSRWPVGKVLSIT